MGPSLAVDLSEHASLQRARFDLKIERELPGSLVDSPGSGGAGEGRFMVRPSVRSSACSGVGLCVTQLPELSGCRLGNFGHVTGSAVNPEHMKKYFLALLWRYAGGSGR